MQTFKINSDAADRFLGHLRDVCKDTVDVRSYLRDAEDSAEDAFADDDSANQCSVEVRSRYTKDGLPCVYIFSRDEFTAC